MGSRLLQVGINLSKVQEELCGAAGPSGQVWAAETNKQKKHVSDAMAAVALSVENMKTRRTGEQAELKLWRCADKADGPQDVMKRTLKRLLAAAMPSLRSAQPIRLAVKMPQNFPSCTRLTLVPMSWSFGGKFSQTLAN